MLVIPLGAVYLAYQKYFLQTSRELKRLDSVSRSPIYAHFQESLGGITTIRAYRQQTRFALENELRMDANLRAYFPSINANRWLAVRLEFLGSVIILAAAIFAIVSVSTGSGLSAGMYVSRNGLYKLHMLTNMRQGRLGNVWVIHRVSCRRKQLI